MRVLAHIHTFNDADIIDRRFEAIQRQTRPVEAILVVNNGSTDCTLTRPSITHAAVMPHRKSLGTGGAVHGGFRFALDHDYDWIWVFDADRAPPPDALERLLDRYASWPGTLQEETALLACLPRDQRDDQCYHGSLFGRHGLVRVDPAAADVCYRCHVTLWSGSLYRLAAVRRIGLPNPDYV